MREARRLVRPGEMKAGGSSAGSLRDDFVPRPRITSINDVQAPAHIAPDSVWVTGSPAWNSNYNMGHMSETGRGVVKLKDDGRRPDDPTTVTRRRYKNVQFTVEHVIRPGTYVKIPELFETGQYGVGQVKEIVDLRGPRPGDTVSLAIVDFGPEQHPAKRGYDPMSRLTVTRLGLALLQKVKTSEADEEARLFRMRRR